MRRQRKTGTWLAGSMLLGAGVLVTQACFNDYDQFDLTGGQTGGASGAGTGGVQGGSGGVVSGGSGGLSGSAGSSGLGGTANAGGASSGTGGVVAGQGGNSGASGTGAAGGSSGASGTGATGGAGAGGVAGSSGASGTAGASGCGSNQKLCATECVPDNDPDTGCADPTSCDPCGVPNATATCESGACAVGTCDPGYMDCTVGDPDDGCEHSLSAPSHTQCGGCTADCTSQGNPVEGGFACSGLLCRCGTTADCEIGNVTADACTDGHCVCGGTDCAPGEACERSGPSSVCRCNGGAACAVAGWVCCPGTGCADLQTDQQNCGACGWQCPAGSGCSDGACQ